MLKLLKLAENFLKIIKVTFWSSLTMKSYTSKI